jgi:small subunit ribosomal protein S6
MGHRCRDKELAKFEAYLNKEECQFITGLVRGRSRMAYPIKT